MMDWGQIWSHMTDLQISGGEKILRTVAVYLGLAILLRLAGKRMLAQLNNFDLVVVLLLSNVVQNAVIGPDNSVSGGLLGAATLLAFNALYVRFGTASPRLQWLLEGRPTELVRQGEFEHARIERLGLKESEVLAALKHQGADSVGEVENATMFPGGSLVVELDRDAQDASLLELRTELARLRMHLDDRFSELERHLG
jgi:uncharacterized membrane protein YcaP (DUF421 family)